LILEPPKNVPENLIHHWIRGYFEGGGHIGIHVNSCGDWERRVTLTGTREVLDFIQNQLKGMGRISPDTRSSIFINLIIDKQEDIKRFADYIYEDATEFLERKKEIFDFVKGSDFDS